MNRKYTPAHLAFIKRRRRWLRQDLLAAFKRKFRRMGMTRLKLQDLCNRYGWGVGSRKGRSTGESRSYSKAELAFISRRRKMPRRELHAGFVKKFRRTDVTCIAIKCLCARKGWATDPHQRRQRTRGKSKYSKAEFAFLTRWQQMPRREFHAAFVKKFQRDISLDAFKALCERRGLSTGRTGQFKKGVVPANKGKKMPFNANSARTQFKKGQRSGRANEVYKPIGSTRLTKEGYLERKIHNGLPMQSRWCTVQRINWERKHGQVPKGHVLKCLDGNKLNTAPSNWELISRGVLALRNKRFAGAKLTPELELTAIAIAKLDVRIGERRRNA